MVPSEAAGQAPGLVVITRHRVPVGETADFLASAREALRLLSLATGFVDASIARSTDEADLLMLTTRWTGVGAYRRALSSYDVKLHAVPLLSTAVDETTAFEVLHLRDGGGVADFDGALAAATPTKFLDLARAGGHLARIMPAFDRPPVVLTIAPLGDAVAGPVAETLGVPIGAMADVAGSVVVVVDAGVETGRAAREIGLAVRAAGATEVVLAVPVCPRDAEASLQGVFDRVVAVVRPMGRRALRWHYEDMSPG